MLVGKWLAAILRTSRHFLLQLLPKHFRKDELSRSVDPWRLIEEELSSTLVVKGPDSGGMSMVYLERPA